MAKSVSFEMQLRMNALLSAFAGMKQTVLFQQDWDMRHGSITCYSDLTSSHFKLGDKLVVALPFLF